MMRLLSVFLMPILAVEAVGGGAPSLDRMRLPTRWAGDVTADGPPPAYPRPQMTRERWLPLDGRWEFAPASDAASEETSSEGAASGDEAPGGAPPQGSWPGRIRVPFPMESDLSGVGVHHTRAWYRRSFEVPTAWRADRVLLHFGAVDWEARVIVNGRRVGEHRGGYLPFTIDITDALIPGPTQELMVAVFDPTDAGEQARGKQVLDPGGIFYTPASGIWQTVWLEPVPATRIGAVRIIPDLEGKRIVVRVRIDGDPAPDAAIAATVVADGKRVAGGERGAGAPAAAGEEIRIEIPDPRPWSPDDPFLYDLKIELRAGGVRIDGVGSYFGMRSIAVRPVDGVPRLILNGEPLFQVGTLDQGFWPDGVYTAPTDDALRFDIEETRRLGFNMIRKHVKIEPDRWYAWCDRLGMLVWQDMPSGNNGDDESRCLFEGELRGMIEEFGSHPSIVMWVVFNEGWGQFDTERLCARVADLDPTRLVSNASGWTDRGVGDVIDLHAYPGPAAPPVEPVRAAVLGEFGGLGLAIDGHTWSPETWGYRTIADRDELTRRYALLLARAHQLRADAGLAAVVYTQTTDVETECNGLFTYDRAVLKVDAEVIAAANRGEIAQPAPVAPTSERDAVPWRMTTDDPGDGWAEPGFADDAWTEAPGGFGTEDTPGAVVRTRWDGPAIWLRRRIELPDPVPADLVVRLHHDERVVVFLNGVRAVEADGYARTYEYFPIEPAAAAALRPGINLLAVHCTQTDGGQFIDCGLSRWSPQRRSEPTPPGTP